MGDSIRDIFRDNPTRPLEEVQKVHATSEAREDVAEFYETDSARAALEELADLVETSPNAPHRFLYVNATFGSGKTHLLKLIGYVTRNGGAPDSVVDQLIAEWGGFENLADRMEQSSVDAYHPIFLNLLDRDASVEPPLPLLLWKAIGRHLCYPTEPVWLLEWAFQRDQAGSTQWKDLEGQRDDDLGSLYDVLEDGAFLRSWLYKFAPAAFDEFDSEQEVVESVREAQSKVDRSSFDASSLRRRAEAAQKLLQERRDRSVEFIFGLDEVALFVGDDPKRYDEFYETIEELSNGLNPIVVGTGQWDLQTLHRDFRDSTLPDTFRRVTLEGAESDDIVRNRWLRKKSDVDLDERLEATPSLRGIEDDELPFTDDAPAPTETYPLRPFDLRLLRDVMEQLLTEGTPTEHEHIQARALLVVVRALFTEHGWADQRDIGELVPWDELFDLLDEETTYIPGWVGEHIGRIEDTTEDSSPTAEVAKVVYLLNHAPDGIPATKRNIAALLYDSVERDFEDVHGEVESALVLLSEETNYLHREETAKGLETYRLLTEDEISLVELIESTAKDIPQPQLRNTLKSWFDDLSDWLTPAGDNRRFVDTEDERQIPLRVRYSLFRRPSSIPEGGDAVTARVLVAGEETDESVDQWLEAANRGPTPREDGLVPVQLGSTFVNRLRRLIASRNILDRHTDVSATLRRQVQDDEQTLRRDLRERLTDSRLIQFDDSDAGAFGADFGSWLERRAEQKFPGRRTLERPLRHQQDARDLFGFFDGSGEWPLEKADADMLGVQRVGPEVEIDNGWAEQFLDEWGDQHSVEGAELLQEIDESTGEYTGTPREALAALLITLAAARKLHLRVDGEAIRNPAEMGRRLDKKAQFEDVYIHFQPLTEESVLERLQSLTELLLRTSPHTRDPEELVEALVEWARNHQDDLRTVESWLDSEWRKGSDRLTPLLEGLLEPANQGGELPEPEQIGTDEVVESARLFRKLRETLIEDDESTWNEFRERYEELESDYPAASVTGDFAAVIQGEVVPELSRLEDLLERAETVDEEEAKSNEELVSALEKTSASEDVDEPGDEDREVLEELISTLESLEEGTPVIIE